MNVVQELASWAKDRPQWQSDALRRIFTQVALAPADEEELLRMLLEEHGVPVEDEQPAVVPVPFSDIVATTSGSARRVLLKELHSVTGVNALVPDQSIAFALDGLTVIYGENGAGKSGYARVFKQACHARDKSEPILGNVASAAKAKAKATIELAVDDQDVAVEWVSGLPTHEFLGDIAVFDSQCARVFLDEANEVVYLPYGMDVFGRLVAVCTSLKAKLKSRLATTPGVFGPAARFKDGTKAGLLVRSLSEHTDMSSVERLATLEEKERSRLTELQTMVATLQANPPKARASQLRRVKSRFDQLRVKLMSLENQISEAALKAAEQSTTAATAAGAAAQLASKAAFSQDPVRGTGSNPWRLLFDAAKAFSETAAYPAESFPVVRDGALCVLCQQQLTVDGADRLSRFQNYVTENVAMKKAAADRALAAATSALQKVDFLSIESDTVLLEELRAHNETLADAVDVFLDGAHARAEAAQRALANGHWSDVPAIPTSVIPALQAAIDSLETAAQKFDAADDPANLQLLKQELMELIDRQLLAQHHDDIRSFIANRKHAIALRACERALDTTAITRAGTDLMEHIVTEQLVTALERELQYFSVKCVPLKLAHKGEKGKIKHQLTIESGARPSGVLSEGEQRIVAIASFLAELETSSAMSPIIFDDPVSSLDHLFRERVAKRLVHEAKGRQVVVFTHDIVMLLAIERECGEQGTKLLIHSVRRSAAGPGECPHPPSRPWHACSTKDRMGILKQASARFKKLSQESPAEYEIVIADAYGKLRETWERAIEEVLLNDAINRFSPAVQTQRLKAVLIESADYAIIEREMGKCSSLMTGHDSAPALHKPAPEPHEFEADIATLEVFVGSIRKRQDAASKAAKTLIDPPQATTARARATNVIRSVAVA